jgi:hypothetical protein
MQQLILVIEPHCTKLLIDPNKFFLASVRKCPSSGIDTMAKIALS